MRFNIETPTRAYLDGFSASEVETLKDELTYTNTNRAQDVKRHYGNVWLRRKDGAAWQEKLDELKSLVKNTLVFTADDGRLYIRPGTIPYTDPKKYGATPPTYAFPTPKKIAWAKMLPFELHPYQEESVVELLKARHANVQICTGAGKSAIILKLLRETGFRAAVIAPSKSIFLELLEKAEFHLGKGNVGTFGDGKKKIGKKFTICIGDSLANVKPGSEEWKFFSNLDMLIVDESHTWGAETLEAICHGVLDKVPYRFFMSATQTRNDGAELLLQSIIGKTVVTLTTKQAVAGGYICPHTFHILSVESSNPNVNSADVMEMKRIHFLGNKNIAAFAAKLANAEAASGRQTLILIEELSQLVMLKKLLTVPFAFAHATKKKDELFKLSMNLLAPAEKARLTKIINDLENNLEDEERFNKIDKIKETITKNGIDKVDPAESVEKFNKAEVMVLVGTSCIATGTNIFPTHNTVNWVGGASEIKTKQGAVGRSVRLHKHNPYKDKCVEKKVSRIWDFDVYDIDIMSRHLIERLTFYQDSGSEIKRINLNAQKVQTGGVR